MKVSKAMHFLFNRKLLCKFPIKQKALRAGCAPRGNEFNCFAIPLEREESQATLYLSKGDKKGYEI